jgi:hypothetical protein
MALRFAFGWKCVLNMKYFKRHIILLVYGVDEQTTRPFSPFTRFCRFHPMNKASFSGWQINVLALPDIESKMEPTLIFSFFYVSGVCFGDQDGLEWARKKVYLFQPPKSTI